ncbi:MAG: hypothetical protein LBT09_12120 [Planctomycetaceae bacterium]|jgi:tetratricopeptide (TPR) repeat protein|nr:hypothetical protein [Planctomycetaceae bacterium]
MLHLNLKFLFICFVLYFLSVPAGDNVVDADNWQTQSVAGIENQKNEQTQNKNNDKNPNSKSEQLFLEGASYEKKDDVEKAMKLYGEGLELARTAELRFVILHRLAVLNAKIKNYAQSERYFRTALKDSNVNPIFLCDFAKLYLDRNRLADAETILKNAVLIAPQNRRTLFNLGQVIALQPDRQAEGLRYLKLALGEKTAYKELAKIYRKLGSENQAQFAEQQAMLAKDEPPKNNNDSNNTSQKEITPAQIEKIKQELMRLEAKEIATVQDKILTENERQLLTNPIAAIKTQQEKTTQITTTIPPTIPHEKTTPISTTPHISSAPLVSVISPPATVTLSNVEPKIIGQKNIEPTNIEPTNSDKKNLDQKNDSALVKLIPDVPDKFNSADKKTDKKTQELRPINFDETINVTKNTSSISTSQIRLIPYQKFSPDTVLDWNTGNLAKPERQAMSDVSLSFVPDNILPKNDRNKPTILVTKKIDAEPSVQIREIESPKNTRQPYTNPTAAYPRKNELRPESQNPNPKLQPHQYQRPNQHSYSQNINVTENRYPRRTNPLQPNYTNHETINVTNNMLQYPIRNNFDSDWGRDAVLPKLELVEATKNNKPKSDADAFLAFRLVSDAQPQTTPQIQSQQKLHNHNQTQQNPNVVKTESPFPQHTKTNIEPNVIEQQPILVIHPIESENHQTDKTPDKTPDKITETVLQNETIIDGNETGNGTGNETDNETANTTDLVNDNSAAQINVTENHNEIDKQIETKIDEKIEAKIDEKIDAKIETGTELAIVNEHKNEHENNIKNENEIEKEHKPAREIGSSEVVLSFQNDTPKVIEQPEEKPVMKAIPEVKTEIVKNIDLSVIRLPADSQNNLPRNNVAQITPKNDTEAVPELTGIKITTPEIQPEVQPEIQLEIQTPINITIIEPKPTIAENIIDKNVDKNINNQINDPINNQIDNPVDKNIVHKLPVELPVVEPNLKAVQNERDNVDERDFAEIKTPEKLISEEHTPQKNIKFIELKRSEKSERVESERVESKKIVPEVVVEPKETFHLPESKSYILWGAPNIVTQKNDGKINDNIDDKKQANKNSANEKTKIEPESYPPLQPKLKPEIAQEIKQEIKPEIARELKPEIKNPKDNLVRKEERLPDDSATLKVPEESEIRVPRRLTNVPPVWNNFENYSDINFDKDIKKNIDTIDDKKVQFDDDVGVSSTRKFRQKQNNQQTRP